MHRDTDVPVALVTGITGQDGGYLAKLLIAKGYVVHGLSRNAGSLDRTRFQGFSNAEKRLHLHNCDMCDGEGLYDLIARIRPTEIYNLAAQSHVQTSFEESGLTEDVNLTGVQRMLKAIEKIYPPGDVRFFQASSSEIFGDADAGALNEATPFRPLSPYATSKRAAFEEVVKLREVQGFFASNGILFNHESPYRGASFVTRKISRAVAARHMGETQPLRLGNLDARRDWGHARDYVEAMWLMLQQGKPGDYVVATGEDHSVREFVERAFAEIGRQIEWQGEGVEETGLDAATGELLVEVDPVFFRPVEVTVSRGDASKAKSDLGWAPRTDFRSLVREMVAADITRLAQSPGAAARPD